MKTMFTNLTKFEYVRTNLQAFGFYLFYLVVGIVLAGILGGISGLFSSSSSSSFSLGLRIGAVVAAVLCTLISYLILQKKGLLRETSSILYLIGTFLLGFLGGAILGMILPAYLSTKAPASHAEIKPTV